MNEETTIAKRTAEEVATAERTRSGLFFRPNVDIMEEADELLVVADMPGTKGDAIAVDFEDGTLTIHGKVDPRQDDGTNYLLHEYGIGDYYRTFEVSESIDAGKISAEYADGVLKLHLPKAESSKPRKISVKT
jgi:HSP20 family protein